MSYPTYSTSSYGATIIIDEGFEDTPHLRWALMTFDLVTLLVVNYHVYSSYKALPKSSQTRSPLLFPIYILFLLSNTLRIAHLIDHTYRPVYYYEPIWNYQKYLVTELELATFVSFPFSVLGYFGIPGLMSTLSGGGGGRGGGGVKANHILIRNNVFKVLLYTIGAFAHLIHYTIEPPWNYGPIPNTTIMGPVFPTLGLVGLSVWAWWSSLRSKGKQGKRGRPSESAKLLIDEGQPKSKSPRKSGRASKVRSRTPIEQ